MNVLRIAKISVKFTWLRVILFVGFLVIGLAYGAAVVVNADNQAKVTGLTDLRLAMANAKTRINDARYREKEFLLRSDPKYIDGLGKTVGAAYRELDKATRLAPTAQTRALVNRIREELKTYEGAFMEAAERQKVLGFDEQTGLHGAMSRAGSEVEALISELGDPVLRSSFLMIRRHEKDFIQHEVDEYTRRMADEQKVFGTLLANSSLSEDARDRLEGLMSSYYVAFKDFVAGTRQRNAAVVLVGDTANKITPLLEEGAGLAATLTGKAKRNLEQVNQNIALVFGIILAGVGTIAIIALWRMANGIGHSLRRLTNTVSRVSEGDDTARSELQTPDELGELSRAIDGMLNERVASLADAEAENARLNNSVIELLEAVAELSNKDLTVTAPVTEDVTGAVADSMNMMVTEMAGVLKEIREIAAEVEEASGTVREQGAKVADVAKNEGRIVKETTAQLGQVSRTINEIAVSANKCNEIGDQAIKHTAGALETVAKTAAGMSSVREAISESEKRIKRLGERSQEISAVIEIINNIAERTQVLALNASMQAAAAGEAGRGFAVVANEVQRLAESSRQSTSEIEALVRSIQTETADAMGTMDKTIKQVIDGAELANRAGQQMDETQKTTKELAQWVQQIAKRSAEKLKVSKQLQKQAEALTEGNVKTERELSDQAENTGNLAVLSQRLVRSVSVFKLPA